MSNNDLEGGIKTRDLPGNANEVSSSERARSDALSLDSIKNISHQKSCHVGYFQGVYWDSGMLWKGVRCNIRCKSWSCPDCRKRMVKQLRKRIFNGNITEFVDYGSPNEKYNYKLLTLTLPGNRWREKFTPDQAYRILQKNWDKISRTLRKKHGKFHFFRVVEPQQDNYPHLHVLMVGRGVAKKEVLETIRNLWSYKYFGEDFANIDLKVVNNFKHGVRYITKYLVKNERTYGKKGKKFSTSEGALMKKEKKHWEKCKFYIGTVRGEGDNVEVFEKQLDPNELDKINEMELKAFINLVMGDGEHPFVEDDDY